MWSEANCAIFLAGNKTDLENLRTVSTDEGRAFAKENGCNFMETSATANMQVTEVFENLVEGKY